MIVFNTDLDNTLIYSYKRDIGDNKICVEVYQGREVSYITEPAFELLNEVRKRMLVVPVTTRSIEQYERISLGTDPFKYALVCNGGILLENGKINKDWYNKTLDIISESRGELAKAQRILERDERRYFELRFIEDLFLFTKCHDHADAARDLAARLDPGLADVFENGDKVYVLPKRLTKGRAVKRFKEYVGADFTVAAGDSRFDVSMLKEADYPIAPCGFVSLYGDLLSGRGRGIIECGQGDNFAEFALLQCIGV